MSKPIPFYRHNASNPDRYSYDANIPGNEMWSEGVIAFHAYTTQQPGTIPIYSHFAAAPNRYLYDTHLHNSTGWDEGKIAFYAYPEAQPGTVPIYRHSATQPQRYYYDRYLENGSGWSEGIVAFHAYPPGWMAGLPETALLSQISMPGTHESMSHYGYYSHCQDWTLAEQLANGLRVFDIRLRYLPGAGGRVNFSVHHGPDHQYAFLDSHFPYTSDCKYFVLDECLDFLAKNPTECVVLLIKQEKDQQIRATFFDAFWKIIDNRVPDPQQNTIFYAGNTVPTLQEARGRIVLVFVDGDSGAAYKLDNPRWGLYWGNIDFQVDWHNPGPDQVPNLDVENHWRDMMGWKWEKVEAHLDKGLGGGPSSKIWFVTFSSASHGSLADHLPADYAAYILPKLQAYLAANSANPPSRPWGSYFGTVLMDFPTKEIIAQVTAAALQYQYA